MRDSATLAELGASVTSVSDGGSETGVDRGDVGDTARDQIVDAALTRLTDDQRAADAVEARRREQSLRLQSAESGSFAGVLTDLAERGDPVALSTVTGRRLRGSIISLGSDHLRIQTATGEHSLVPIASVASVRSAPGGPATVGDRDVSGTRELASVLADLAVERPRAAVHLLGGEAVTGTLWSAGQDLLALRANDGSTTYVAITAIGDLLLV